MAAHQVNANGEYRSNRFTDTARPGETLVLWGTGLASTAPRRDVVVYIGDRALQPVYAGPAPGQQGVDQINVVLPENVPTGCFVPLVVQTGATVSDVYTVSIGVDAVCQPELRFFDRKIAAMDEGGAARAHALTVWTEDSGLGKRGAVEAWIADYDLADAAVLTLETLELPMPPRCVRTGRAAPPGFHGTRLGPPVGLSVAGANGCALEWTTPANGVWRAAIEPRCVPTGAMVELGNGGRSWSSLETSMPWPLLPVMTVWRPPLSTVTWQGGSYAGRFALEAGSEFRLHGNIFGGMVYSQRKLYCRLQGDEGSLKLPDLDWAFGLPEQQSAALVLRQGFVSAAWSGSSSTAADFAFTHVRHDLVTPLPLK